jgi:hypothetical protein
VIPANIRYQHYEKVEDIKLENKFAPIPLTIPLSKDLIEAFKLIPKASSKLRNAFGEVYATYAGSYYSSMLSPYFLSNWFLNRASSPITLAFSNTPGLLKPVYVEGKKTIK